MQTKLVNLGDLAWHSTLRVQREDPLVWPLICPGRQQNCDALCQLTEPLRSQDRRILHGSMNIPLVFPSLSDRWQPALCLVGKPIFKLLGSDSKEEHHSRDRKNHFYNDRIKQPLS